MLLVFRVQVGSEAVDPILGGDNAISVQQIRRGAACFAAPEVLSVCGRRAARADGAGCRRFTRVPRPDNG